MFSRRQRTTLPTIPTSYDQLDTQEISAATNPNRKAKRHIDKHSVILQPFNPGDSVVIQDPIKKKWDKYGIIKSNVNDRSYEVKFNDNSILRRNRRFIRASKNVKV